MKKLSTLKVRSRSNFFWLLVSPLLTVLTDDYSKLCFLGASNSVFFHAKYGHYHTTRLSSSARSLHYDRATCDLYITGATDELLRLNLEAGRFLEPIRTEFSSGINAVTINPVHSLIGLAGSDSFVEFRDPRAPEGQSLARVDIAGHLMDARELINAEDCKEVTALTFSHDGLHVAAGTGSGHLLLFDLRSPKPLWLKDHRNEKKIHRIQFHKENILSADRRVIKIWNETTAESVGNIETTSPCNDFLIWPDSGLIFATGEAPDTMTYYAPALGNAPKWCAFLDSVVEDVDENAKKHNDEIYENFKFISIEQLHEIGGSALIGTPYLRQYMHGFFISSKLYWQMRIESKISPFFLFPLSSHILFKIAEDPDAFDRKNKVRSKMAELRSSRISLPDRPAPAVAAAAGKKKAEEEEEDFRFQVLQTNPNFAVEEKFQKISGGGDGVAMFEARDDEADPAFEKTTRSERMKKDRKKKMTLGELAAEHASGKKEDESRKRGKVSESESRFLTREAKLKIEQKKQEKRERIEHNKSRRKASAKNMGGL